MRLDGSKSAGALVGAYSGQLICVSLEYFAHIPVNTATATSITGILVLIFSHWFKNAPAVPLTSPLEIPETPK